MNNSIKDYEDLALAYEGTKEPIPEKNMFGILPYTSYRDAVDRSMLGLIYGKGQIELAGPVLQHCSGILGPLPINDCYLETHV